MTQQYRRRASLIISRPESRGNNPSAYVAESNLDLSELHFQFKTQNQDEEAPTNCAVRVFNLSKATRESILKFDYSRLVLQAGYDGQFGVIFDGTIKQFRTGRLNGTDTYMDILAADGDLGYNFGLINRVFPANSTSYQRRAAVVDDLGKFGITMGADLAQTGGTLPRGKVLFGLPQAIMHSEVKTNLASWSIQNGKVQILDLDGYLPTEAVVLTGKTGLVGIPEQTQDGIKCRCLLNPRIIVGGRIFIDNESVNRTIAQSANPSNIAFNSRTQPQFLANVSADGAYRVFVAEHEGDSRGRDWYTDITALAIDVSSGKVRAT